jgi:hypothetical protein
VLGVKAKPAKAGRFASLDPCARIRLRTTMIVAAEPGLAADPVSCEFRFSPATNSDLKPATIPI